MFHKHEPDYRGSLNLQRFIGEIHVSHTTGIVWMLSWSRFEFFYVVQYFHKYEQGR